MKPHIKWQGFRWCWYCRGYRLGTLYFGWGYTPLAAYEAWLYGLTGRTVIV